MVRIYVLENIFIDHRTLHITQILFVHLCRIISKYIFLLNVRWRFLYFDKTILPVCLPYYMFTICRNFVIVQIVSTALVYLAQIRLDHFSWTVTLKLSRWKTCFYTYAAHIFSKFSHIIALFEATITLLKTEWIDIV